MVLEVMAPITFNRAKAQVSQKSLETLELALKYVHHLPIRGNIFGLLWLPCGRALGYSLPYLDDPTSLDP